MMSVVEMNSPPASEEAYTAFYREHYRSVVGFIRHAYPRLDAEDVAATVFTIAWRRFGQIPDLASKAWLFGVVRYTINNDRRARRRAELLIDRTILNRPRTAVSQADETVSAEVWDQLVAGFNKLREDDREILLFAAWGGLDASELAITLGITKNAATVRLHRARERLRRTTGLGLDNSEEEGERHGVA